MVIKAAGGAICIGLVVTGIVGLADPGALGMMPRYTDLSKDSEYGDNGSYKDKFGGKHKDKLVGANGNKKWWEWSYEKLKADKVRTGEFFVEEDAESQRVGSAYSATAQSTQVKALNRVCENVYKSGLDKITKTGNEQNAFTEEHVWKYCSWLGKKPTQQA